MKVEMTGRNGFVPTEANKEYARKRLSKVIDFFGKDVIRELRVVGKIIRNEHRVEVTLLGKGVTLRAEVSDADMYAAIDKVTDKMIAQIRKNKDKLKNKLEREGIKKTYSEAFEEEVSQPQTGALVKNKKIALDPITPDEAILELELVGHDFYVFLNKETNKTSVVYKRFDGDYAIIETE